MKKKEFAVGEVFQFGLKKLKVEKYEGCELCVLHNLGCDDCCNFTGSCMKESRGDKTDVMFVEVEEEE